MNTFIGIAIAAVLVVLLFVIGGMEIVKSVRNPKPLMENGDKRFSDIKKEKTRSILHVEVR